MTAGGGTHILQAMQERSAIDYQTTSHLMAYGCKIITACLGDKLSPVSCFLYLTGKCSARKLLYMCLDLRVNQKFISFLVKNDGERSYNFSLTVSINHGVDSQYFFLPVT